MIKAPGFVVGMSEDRNSRWRRAMEDTHTLECNFNDIPGQGFFAVYDGHVGKETSEWCKHNFHKVFSDKLKTNEGKMSVTDVLNDTFLSVDRQIAEKKHSSGCTAAVAYIQAKGSKRTLYVGNVGDARAVLCRNDSAVRLTYDHKGSDPNEAKRITDLGGFMLNNRVNGMLAVTRSLGDSQMKEFVIGSPYTTETVLTTNDKFLILACDGLWDACEDQTAVDLIRDVDNAQEASEKLLDHALANHSTDNLSIMVIRFTSVDEPVSPSRN